MQLYAELHSTPANRAEDGEITGGIEQDLDSFIEVLPAMIRQHLDGASEGDELIITITVQDEG